MPRGDVIRAVHSGPATNLRALSETEAGTPVRKLLTAVAVAIVLALLHVPSGLGPRAWSTAAHAEDAGPPATPGTRDLADTPFQLVLPQGHLFGDWGGT